MTVNTATQSPTPNDSVPTGLPAAAAGVGARFLLRRAAARCGVAVVAASEPVPDGPALRLLDADAVGRRIGTGRLIGFGESYVAGEWDSPDLPATLTALATRMPTLVPRWVQALRPLAAIARPASDVGTPDHAASNVSHHYDLSNELFATFLDRTMTYSSALYSTVEIVDDELDVTRAPDPGRTSLDDLAPAQHAKIDRLLDAAQVGPGSDVLEIGTGWGELCIRAASRGAHVRSVTLSVEQRDLARRRVAEAGYADRVDIELCDYRSVRGSYDAIVSVEMIEAVGAAHWDEFFAVLAQSLKPDGRVALQAITMPHDRMLATLRTYTWIQKYIFPGGMLPSTEAIVDAAGGAGLAVRSRHRFGSHYAETLRAWRDRFLADPASLPPPADTVEFRRLWEFYLAYSEAGFRSGYLDVQQITLSKEVLQ